MLNTLAGTLGFEACFRRAEETPFLLGEVSDAGGGLLLNGLPVAGCLWFGNLPL